MNNLYSNFDVIIEYHDDESRRDISKEEISALCKVYFYFYAFILHDKDEGKRYHYHIVGFSRTRKRFDTLINDFAKLLKVSPNIISVERVYNVNKSLRYLIHFDNKEKYGYDFLDIFTNDNERLDSAFIFEFDYLTFNDIMKIINDCNYNLVSIISKIGVDNYKRYRVVIIDILNQLKSN